MDCDRNFGFHVERTFCERIPNRSMLLKKTNPHEKQQRKASILSYFCVLGFVGFVENTCSCSKAYLRKTKRIVSPKQKIYVQLISKADF